MENPYQSPNAVSPRSIEPRTPIGTARRIIAFCFRFAGANVVMIIGAFVLVATYDPIARQEVGMVITVCVLLAAACFALGDGVASRSKRSGRVGFVLLGLTVVALVATLVRFPM